MVNYHVTVDSNAGYSYTMIMKKFVFTTGTLLCAAVVIVSLFSACATSAVITEDMTSAEIIQRAQEAMDRNRYNIAVQYYQALYERNQNSIDLLITAEYHIAFIHYKQKKYELAREGMNDVISYYDNPDAVFLPQHFKRLAQIVIATIEEKHS